MDDSLLEQARKIREKRNRDLARTFARGKAGGVAAKLNGHRQLVSIRIDPKVLGSAKMETLKEQILEAVNAATDEMEAILERKFGPSSGIPDLF